MIFFFLSHCSVRLTDLSPPITGSTLARWAAKTQSDTYCIQGICGELSWCERVRRPKVCQTTDAPGDI